MNADHKPDPLLASADYGSCLILGRSGSGKSSLLKESVSLMRRASADSRKFIPQQPPQQQQRQRRRKIKLVTVNAKSDEYDQLGSGRRPPKRLEYKSLCRAPKHSVVIIEDIISMSIAEERCLRQLLNYDCHHKRIKVFMIAHHVYKTSIHSLLAFFNYILFTSDHTNVPLIRITLMYFKINSEQIANWIDKFKSHPANYTTFFFFDCKNLSFNTVSGVDNLLRGTNVEVIGVAGITDSDSSDAAAAASLIRSNLQQRFDKFVAGQARTKANASAIFSMIIHCLPLKLIREHDLTLVFGSKSPAQPQSLTRNRVSFVDYIDALLTADLVPDNKIIFLHKFVQKSCQIPKMFILNQILQRL